jgi:NADH dehydrogenase
VVSIRAFVPATGFCMAEVTGVDTQRRIVHYRLPEHDRVQAVEYDHLVLAFGSVTNLPNVPGLREFGFELKSLADAVALQDRAIELLELAASANDQATRRAMLHFVVVGGNFTGVEVAGEFERFLRHAVRRYQNLNASDVSVTLVELTERILRALDPELSDYATERLRRRGISVRLNDSVERIDADRVRLSSGEMLQARTVIWCAGIAPAPIVAQLPFATDRNGYILTDRDLRVPGFENIWAIGDCAVNPGPDGRAYPATAQHAVRQAAHAAGDIVRVLQGGSTRPCNIASSGSLAALGCRTGVARVFGFRLSGFLAWWLWRTVYLLKMPGFARKARVALDWTVDFLFPHDYVQLGVHRAVHKPSVQREEPSRRVACMLETVDWRSTS